MIKQFKCNSVNMDSDNIIYMGSIQEKPAICIFPKKSILKDEFIDIIQEETELKLQNDIYYAFTVKSRVDLKFRLIWPATEKYFTKYNSNLKFYKETYEEHEKTKNMKPVQWIENILSGKEEKFRYFEDNRFILMPNYKWNELSVDDLEILLIFKDSNLRSIRDLTDTKLLLEAKELIIEQIKQFNLSYEDVVLYFHYKPTYDHLHLHVSNVNLSGSSSLSVTRARLLEDVIYNINLDPNYYKRDIWYSKKINK